MTNIVNMTADQVRAMDADTLVESIAQMLYDHAEIAQKAEDDAITAPIKERYREKSLTYCGAAEHVRSLLND